ncbi:MAG: hypothetical protein KF810_17350 [Rhizobiaceae bacterium]|nr:hypothetical protein [Rhizobiaceae bacterium]
MKKFADKLLAASEDEDISREELQELLRQASEKIRGNDAFEALERLDALNTLRAQRGEPLLGLESILDDWSISQGDLPWTDLDEDTETKGSA